MPAITCPATSRAPVADRERDRHADRQKRIADEIVEQFGRDAQLSDGKGASDDEEDSTNDTRAA